MSAPGPKRVCQASPADPAFDDDRRTTAFLRPSPAAEEWRGNSAVVRGPRAPRLLTVGPLGLMG
jgi:hypothetical protein